MTFSSSSRSFKSLLVFLLVLWSNVLYSNGCYPSIISFGDSLADTGNFKYMASISHKAFTCLQQPYGETFFHEPTGRCSNGRLIIDFLAESLGLPFIPPFLHDKEGDNVVVLGQGLNYAVVGATALNSSFIEVIERASPVTNVSLGVELAWFKQSLSSICNNTSECRNLIGRSLIMMGAIGGGDYNNLANSHKPVDEFESYTPLIIDTIIMAVNELIDMGAQTLVVPGCFPIGCSPAYLTIHGSKNEEYDNSTGCLVRFNEIAKTHNKLLQTKVNHLRELHPNVIIIYADYYNAAMQNFRSPDAFGFTNWALKSCCGGGGPFNYNPSVECGSTSATVCENPDTYVYWDGVHYTEAAYKLIFESLFYGPYTTPKFSSLCPASISQASAGLSGSSSL